MRTWLALLIALPPCVAAPPKQLVPAGNLRVENVSVATANEKKPMEFDVVNAGDREAVAWLLTAIFKPGDWTYVPFDRACGTEPLAPQEVRHCHTPLYSELKEGQLAVTAVLFADGSSAGDLEPLRNEGETRAILSQIGAYWSWRAREISESVPAPEALRQLEGEMGAPVERPGYDVYNTQALIELNVLRNYVRQRVERMKPGEEAQALARVRSDLEKSARGRADQARRIPLRRSEEPPPPARLPEVENLTRGIEVVHVDFENGGGTPRLVLKNNYDRAVRAFTMSERTDDGLLASGNGDWDCLSLGWTPGGVVAAWPRSTGRPVIISSAVFEDGSGDGDQAQVREVVENWHRQRDIVRQKLPLLEDLLRLSDVELPAAVDELVAQWSTAETRRSAPGCSEPEQMANILRSNRELPMPGLRAQIKAEIDTATARLKRP